MVYNFISGSGLGWGQGLNCEVNGPSIDLPRHYNEHISLIMLKIHNNLLGLGKERTQLGIGHY